MKLLVLSCLAALLGSFSLVSGDALLEGAQARRGTPADWSVSGGSPGNGHFSPLKQIDLTNVAKLREVWRYDTHEAGGLETTPLVIGGVVYAYTPGQKVIALDGKTGRLLWNFDSHVTATGPNRGLTYWSSGGESRLLAGVMQYLYALDPKTGEVIASFGDGGRIDLRENLGRKTDKQSIALTSPGVICQDLIIVGGRTPETLPAPPGDIRAYDVRTGKMRWTFHTIPHPGEAGYETWPKDAWKSAGSANAWAGMAVDVEHGIVYAPTGSAAPDFYGGERLGDDLYADTLLALNAETGERIWHFQGIRHDLWDRDFPSAPVLFTMRRGGKDIPAIAQTTKQGVLYVFNRLTGEPLFPIGDRVSPPSTIPGEKAAARQPYPAKPAPFARQEITEADLTERTPEVHRWAVEQFRKMRHDGPYVPFGLERETLLMPSFEGGAEWGGPAVDPATSVLYVNANDYASIGGMAAHREDASGRSVFLSQCSVCHGQDRAGSPPVFPSLVGVGSRLTSAQIAAVVHEGRGRMPAFSNLDDTKVGKVVKYLETGGDAGVGSSGEPDPATAGASVEGASTQYTMTGYRRFLDPDGYPAVAPPWGTLSAIDLNTGEYLWKRPLGEYPALAAKGVKETGTENYGGPLVTDGGLIFIGATNFDKKFRAFDKRTGKLLWETVLPFAGNATPATYEVDGRQYVVIAAGGSSLMVAKGSLGGTYVAFALP